MSMAVDALGLGKRYRSRWALRHATFRIPAGRVVALVGPNGAGKTTLLHLIAGLLTPTAGHVRVFGSNPVHDAALLPRVGFVAQDAPMYRAFTIDDTLAFGMRTNPEWDDSGARAWLASAGINVGHRVGQLSGGQRAQLALHLALAKRPELLLLDEPLASLDPLARRSLMQTLMTATVGTGLTVVLSSHLLGELERLCDTLILVSSADVQINGSIDELLATHRLLIGPRRDEPLHGVGDVIQHRRTDRQSTVLVRTKYPIADPAWTVQDVTLEELVMAYIGASAETVLPKPKLRPVGTEA